MNATSINSGYLAAYARAAQATGSAGANAQPENPAAILSFTGEAAPPAAVPEENRLTLAEEAEQMQAQIEAFREQFQAAVEAGEAKAEAMRMMAKALEIARRIMMGDDVPAKDHRFLAEYDAALYGKALTMRINRADPIQHESLVEDEEENGATEGTSTADSSRPSGGQPALPPTPDVGASSPESPSPSE